MKINVYEQLQCEYLPCKKMNTNRITIPNVQIDTKKIQTIMISEAPPTDPAEYFYENGEAFYFQTISQAFDDAGLKIKTMNDLIKNGIYITTAVKCAKTEYSVPTTAIKNCMGILEKELALFPNLKVYMLMGDVAIKAFNYIIKKNTGMNVIPNVSTYKIRNNKYYFEDKRVFPSYVLTGKNFLIERSKREMIAEDIRQMLGIIY